MTRSALFGFTFLDAQHSQPEVVINEFVVYLEVITSGVISVGLNTPPGSPGEGDAYILGASPTGAWAGRANAIAYYSASGWRFLPNVNSAGTIIAMGAVHDGLKIINKTDGQLYVWNGTAWAAYAPATIVDGWNDNLATISDAATGPAAPTLTAFGPSGTSKQKAFAVNDSVYIIWHIGHDIKPASTAHMHVHWSTNGTSTEAVKWQISYTSAKGHDQANFPADTVISIQQAAAGTAWRHMIAEDATGFTIPEPDSVIIGELKRITNGGTDNADTVFGLFVDIHYEADRNGTPSRTPDFYT